MATLEFTFLTPSVMVLATLANFVALWFYGSVLTQAESVCKQLSLRL